MPLATALQFHAVSPEKALSHWSVSSGQGLSPDEVKYRRSVYGSNTLPQKKSKSLFRIFLDQFKSPLIYLLFIAAAIAFFLGKVTDGWVIIAVLFANAAIGAFQEGRAEKSMEALRKLSELSVRVLRGGKEKLAESSELVPGDILALSSGDAVAADARLIEAQNLEAEEAALTGESFPVGKNIEALSEETVLADRHNMVYSGTFISSGRGKAVVVATGLRTEVGRISELTQEAKEPNTPLESRIAQFGNHIIVAASVMLVVVVITGLLRKISFSEIFMVAVSQMVSFVPEGLPVAMTVALAIGMQRMAARGAVIRKLSAVETLGSTNVIASDKTGTLTKNEMTVTELYLPDERKIEVSGAGYEPEGEFLYQGQYVDPDADAGLKLLLKAGVLCNDADLIHPDSKESRWRAMGDPTEAALLSLGEKAGIIQEELNQLHPRTREIPFSPETKMMATGHREAGGERLYIKGAPEAVLELCALDESGRRKILEAGELMAQQALRLIAFAIAEAPGVQLLHEFGVLKGKARFLGLAGQFDPPREEVKKAVRQCQSAGIRPIMVTGDHKATGLAVARFLGIAGREDVAVDGRELARMSDEELKEKIDRISVFTRVHPAQKLRIVEALQSRHHVVAVTGDGVNDAPALAKADVGVAMGITGTEVAKNAAKMVITDDNFATIVHAIEEGRLVYRNIKKLLLYLVSTSIDEVLVLLFALILGYPLPLAAVQILWINLVTDGMMTLPLVMTAREGDEMQHPPIPRREPLFTKMMWMRMAVMVPCTTLSTLGYFIFKLSSGVPFGEVQTGTFTVLAVTQWLNAINCLSETKSAFSWDVFKNKWLIGGLVLGNLFHISILFSPPLQRFFHTTTIPISEIVLIGAVASLVFWAEELRKWAARNAKSAKRDASPQENRP
ncbi:MAG: HAD-IC family P-type ATPase [Candidatus Omnitrophica bacterium]|nr:HAD-IC family P-type ATPase [Candidatus Omnitrophota bacterium]